MYYIHIITLKHLVLGVHHEANVGIFVKQGDEDPNIFEAMKPPGKKHLKGLNPSLADWKGTTIMGFFQAFLRVY